MCCESEKLMCFRNFLSKRGAAKVDALIMYIAVILAASVVVTVLIPVITSTSDRLRFTTGESIRHSNFLITVLNIFGDNAIDKDIELIKMRLKIQPGSSTVNFGNLYIHGSTEDGSTDMILGEHVTGLTSAWKELNNDLVDFASDKRIDFIRLTNSTHIQINVSNGTKSYNLSYVCDIPLKRLDTEISIASANGDIPVEILTQQSLIDCSGSRVGSVDIVGFTHSPNGFGDEITVIVGHGEQHGFGAFAVDYVLKGKKWLDGYLNDGDAALVMFIPHRELQESDIMQVRFIPVYGVYITYYIETPAVLNRDRVVLKIG